MTLGSTREAAFLRTVNFIMLLAGKKVAEDNRKFSTIAYKIYSYFINFYMVFFHLLYILAFVLDLECKYYFRETMSAFCRSIGCFLLPFLINSSLRQEILEEINQNEDDITNLAESDIKQIYSKHRKRINILVGISILVMAAVLILWMIHVFMLDIDEMDPQDKCSITEGQIFQLHFITNTLIQKFIANLTPCAGGMMILYARALPATTVGYISLKIKVLQAYMRKIDANVQEELRNNNTEIDQCRLVVLKKIAQEHQHIIRLTKKVQSMNRAVVFLFYFGDAAFTASFVISITTSEDISASFFDIWVVLATLIGLYAFSLLASDIIFESTQMADILFYETNWTDYDKKSKSVIYLMILRSQQPLAINSPIIGVMSLGTFLQIIKLCYTIHTFFATMNTK